MEETLESICKGCGGEYKARVKYVMGVKIVFGRDYCKKCSRKIQDEEAVRQEASRLAGIVKTRQEWRDRCGISRKFMASKFGTFNTDKFQQAYKVALSYADGYPLDKRPHGYPSLVICSSKSWGVGKTHLAGSIIHRILDRWNGEDIPNPVWFVTEPDVFRSIRATYSFNQEERQLRESEDDIIRRLCSVPLLVLDDLGKEETQDTRFVQRVLYTIIDSRYRKMLPMVITANLDKDGLATHLGGNRGNEASFDRLVEMCGGRFIQMEGASFRRKG